MNTKYALTSVFALLLVSTFAYSSEKILEYGDNQMEAGKYEEEAEGVEKTVDAAPKDRDYYKNRATDNFLKYRRNETIDKNRLATNQTELVKKENAHLLRSILSDLQKAIDLKPRDWHSYFYRGIVLQEEYKQISGIKMFAERAKNLEEKIIRDFSKSIRIDPSNAGVYSKRAEFYKLIGNDELYQRDKAEADRLYAHQM